VPQALDTTRGARLLHGVRQSHNWWQLARFTTVGAGGYAVNLATFALVLHGAGGDYRLASVVAFVVAVANNFWWNRHWTFDASDGHAGRQAGRFFTISVAAYAVNFAVLELLVSVGHVEELLAQAIAVASATPCNFLGNKLWTFDA
jgi:dolichol-phosphate mannosyltransferase